MEPKPNRCPKCDGNMTQGYILDSSDAAFFVSSWTSGIPRKSFWTGTKRKPRKELMPIGVFRCSLCGFLEAYARSEFAAQ